MFFDVLMWVRMIGTGCVGGHGVRDGLFYLVRMYSTVCHLHLVDSLWIRLLYALSVRGRFEKQQKQHKKNWEIIHGVV